MLPPKSLASGPQALSAKSLTRALAGRHLTRKELMRCVLASTTTYATKSVDKPQDAKHAIDSNEWDAWKKLSGAELEARVKEVVLPCKTAAKNTSWYGICSMSRDFPDISLVEHLDTDHCNTIKGMFFNYNIDGCCSVWREGNIVLVAWRGTDTFSDAIVDMTIWKTKFTTNRNEMKKAWCTFFGRFTKSCLVHKGFLEQYLCSDISARVNALVAKLLEEIGPEAQLHVTGHSLGGALANLSAFELADVHPTTPILLLTMGAPRVGNPNFAKSLEAKPNVRAYRLQNGMDVVSRIPMMCYQHAGTHIWIRMNSVRVPENRPGYTPFLAKLPPIRFWGACWSIPEHKTHSYIRKLEKYRWAKGWEAG